VRPRRHWALLCGPSTSPLGDVGVRFVSTSFCVLALVVLALCASATGQETLSARDRAEILTTVSAIRSAIRNENVNALLQHVSAARGLHCTDTNYSYNEIKRFLADRRSYLYMGLFDSPAFSRECSRQYSPEYPAISDRDFLKTADESVTITTVRKDWVEVTIKSRAPSQYPRQWYLHREGQAWKLAGDSLIIGNCSCG
jgi:hypothetical protein